MSLANHVRATITSVAGDLPKEVLQPAVQDVLQRFSTVRLPASGETAAIAMDRSKTAALFYDRVWSPPLANDVPHSIAFHGRSTYEVDLVTLMLLASTVEHGNELNVAPHAVIESMRQKTGEIASRRLVSHAGIGRRVDESITRAAATAIAERHSVTVVPVFESAAARDAEYRIGQHEAVIALLSNLSVVDEEALSWEQVVQFRSDPEARSAFRSCAHWLDRDMVGKPLSYIEDDIGIRLEAYDRAVRTHGLRTVVGSLSALVDSRFLAAATLATTVAAHFSGGLAALVAGAALGLGKVSLHIASVLIDATANRDQAAGDIALVIEARKRFTKSPTA